MRLLFTFVGGLGHSEPLAPLARAAAEAGHDVAFACGPAMAGAIERAGFRAFAIGARASGASPRLPLRAVDREREERELRERFVRRTARERAPRLLSLCRDWRPDALVCDETDFGAALAAERLGLPSASVLVIASGAFVRPQVVGAALDELRAEHGLPPDPELERPGRYLVLSPFPQSLRHPGHPLPDTGHAFRASAMDPSEPPWPVTRPDAPTVYFTLGTVFNVESGDLLARGVAGLRELPVNLLVTIGHAIDPAELGPQPAHVRVERFVPQARVLPHCDLVVSHGGSGSVLGALAHGLPSLLIPLGADQPLNAERCEALGVAQTLDALEATPERIRSAAADVLDDTACRRSAERLRDEIAALPDVTQAVRLLERLAAEKRPLYSVRAR